MCLAIDINKGLAVRDEVNCTLRDGASDIVGDAIERLNSNTKTMKEVRNFHLTGRLNPSMTDTA